MQIVKDGNDTKAISEAIKKAKAETDRPSIINVRTHIAFGSPNKVDTAGAHGSPLGEPEVKLVKKNLGFDPEQYFVVPDEVLNYYREAGKKGAENEKAWNALLQVKETVK